MSIVKKPHILLICIVLVAAPFGFALIQDQGEMVIGRTIYDVDLPIFVKFAALKERQEYFNVWINNVITKGILDPEERIDKIFEFLIRFPEMPDNITNAGLLNIEQHEYYTLIKQYSGNPSDIERVFCLLVTIAGYQAIPFEGEADGRVIVRIPESDKWKHYDLRNKVLNGDVKGIALTEKVKDEVRSIDTYLGKLWNGKYTRGDKNVPSRRIAYELRKKILGAKYISAMNNERLIW